VYGIWGVPRGIMVYSRAGVPDFFTERARRLSHYQTNGSRTT
jgi:hypothetical protein